MKSTLASIFNLANVCYNKISSSTYIRARYYSQVQQQCIRDEETCSTRLRGFVAGALTNLIHNLYILHTDEFVSVPYLFLKVSSPNHMTKLFTTCFLNWRLGTPLQSSDYIPNQLLLPWKGRRQDLEPHYENFPLPHVTLIRLRIYHQRNQLEDVETQLWAPRRRSLKLRSIHQQKRKHLALVPNANSTYHATNHTLLVTMLKPFGCMERLITTVLSRYVLTLFFLFCETDTYLSGRTWTSACQTPIPEGT